MRLTDEQRDVVEKNHSLIYWYANYRHLDLEEWYDLLAIELCKTVIGYDKTIGSITTYYKLRCDNLTRKEYKRQHAKKNFHNGLCVLQDNFHIDYDLQNMIELNDLLKDDVIRLKYEGYTQNEIGEKLGLSQGYISKILAKKKDDLMEDNK